MTNKRPDSPLGRIASPSFYYCIDCNCDDCAHVFNLTFCPRCQCLACTKDPKDPPYVSEYDEDDQPPALGKRKQKFAVISPVKRVKAGSVNTVIKNRVSEAAISATNASSPVPSNVSRFCLLSLGHRAEDCLETCHIVPRALGEDDVLFFPLFNVAITYRYLSSSKSSSLPGVIATMASIFIPGTT